MSAERPSSRPAVSVVVPAYRSERTIARSLRSFESQTYPSYELIVVDSSPDEATARIVSEGFPRVRLVRSEKRLLPHGARNRGVELSRGDLFVFTDPDVYAPPDWLGELVGAYERHGTTLAGAIDCHGRAWLARGMHYSKFDEWLPGGEVRPIDYAATANMLCPRTTFERIGGFDSEEILGDAIASRRTRKEGLPILFVPRARVEHHHVGSFGRHLVERYERGREFGRLRVEWGLSGAKLLLQALVTLLPLRLLNLLLRGGRNAKRAGRLLDFATASPLVALAQWAWLLGELAGYLDAWKRGGAPMRCESSS